MNLLAILVGGVVIGLVFMNIKEERDRLDFPLNPKEGEDDEH